MVGRLQCYHRSCLLPPPTSNFHPTIASRNIILLQSPAKAIKPAMARASHSGASPQLLEAAKYTVDTYVSSGMVVGLGTGSASAMAIQYLGRLLQEGNLKNIVGVPMSVSSNTEATEARIPLNIYQDDLQIDFAFDDPDVVQEGSLAAVIGRRKLEGGESIIPQRCVVKGAKNLAFIVNEKRFAREFEGSIPVVIRSVNWMDIAEEVDDLFLGDAEVWRRAAFGHADPMGGDYPLITTEGHHILDVIFTSPIKDIFQVAQKLDQIDGVVGHGLIIDAPCTTIIAMQDGLQIVDNLSMNTVKDS